MQTWRYKEKPTSKFKKVALKVGFCGCHSWQRELLTAWKEKRSHEGDSPHNHTCGGPF
jgi:hypothetical protein